MAFNATTPTGQSFSDPGEWYDQYLADLTALGGTLAQEEYTPYGGPRTAEWTPDQLDAFARTRDAADMWKPYVDPAMAAINAGRGGLDQMQQLTHQAVNTSHQALGNYGFANQMLQQAGTAAGAQGNYDLAKDMTRQAGTYQDPLYESTFWGNYSPVVDQMQQAARDIGARKFENTTLKQLNDTFTGSGQFGSGRHQILGADAASLAQADIERQTAELAMQGRQYGMQDYLNWATQQGSMAGQHGNLEAQRAQDAFNIAQLKGQTGAQAGALADMSAKNYLDQAKFQGQMGAQMGQYAQNQSMIGTDLMNFGLGNQQAALMDAASIGNIGTLQQGQNQQNLNLAYQDFQDQQNFPWQQLNNWSSLVRGGAIPGYDSQVTMPQVTPTTQQNPWAAALQGAAGGWPLGSSFGGG